MELFLKIWQSVGEQGKLGIGLAVFLLTALSAVLASLAFDSTVGRWAKHRWPDLDHDIDEDDDE